MTTAIDRFSPEMLHDLDRLKTLFNAEKEMQEIQAACVQSSSGQLYYSRWEVVWIVTTAPFYILTSLVLDSLATLTCCFEGTSRKLHLYALGFSSDFFHLFSQWSYGSRFLAPGTQLHRLDADDVYTASSVPKSAIGSQRLRESIWNIEKFSTIDFYNEGGNCRGSTIWFNFLFIRALRSQDHTRSTTYKDLAKAVAAQFKEGVPRQAALLQSLGGAEAVLLSMEEREMLCFSTQELHSSRQRILKAIEALPDGVYHPGSIKHGFSYLKFKGQQMIYDANFGLYTVANGSELLEEIEYYMESDDTGSIYRCDLRPVSREIDVDETAG